MRKIILWLLLLITGLIPVKCRNLAAPDDDLNLTPDRNKSIIRVNITRQGYYFHRPWQMRRPSNRSAIGVVIPGGKILVTALPLADPPRTAPYVYLGDAFAWACAVATVALVAFTFRSARRRDGEGTSE